MQHRSCEVFIPSVETRVVDSGMAHPMNWGKAERVMDHRCTGLGATTAAGKR